VNEVEVMRLKREGYSEEAIDTYRRFGRRATLLYTYIDSSVKTPQGVGVLHQVIGGTALVVLDREERKGRWSGKEKRPMSGFRVEEVTP